MSLIYKAEHGTESVNGQNSIVLSTSLEVCQFLLTEDVTEDTKCLMSIWNGLARKILNSNKRESFAETSSVWIHVICICCEYLQLLLLLTVGDLQLFWTWNLKSYVAYKWFLWSSVPVLHEWQSVNTYIQYNGYRFSSCDTENKCMRDLSYWNSLSLSGFQGGEKKAAQKKKGLIFRWTEPNLTVSMPSHLPKLGKV